MEEVYLTMGGYFEGTEVHHIKFEGDSALLTRTLWQDQPTEKLYSSEEHKVLLDHFKKLHLEYWKS